MKHEENDDREDKEKDRMCGVGEGTERKQQTQNYDNFNNKHSNTWP